MAQKIARKKYICRNVKDSEKLQNETGMDKHKGNARFRRCKTR
jgi:hypothetical protein